MLKQVISPLKKENIFKNWYHKRTTIEVLCTDTTV